MVYLIQAAAYTGAMAAIYALLLRNRPFHALSRAYLIMAAVLPLALPLLTLPAAVRQALPIADMLSATLPTITVGSSAPALKAAGHGAGLLPYLYGGLALLVLLWNFSGLWRMGKIIAGSNTRKGDGYTLLLSTGYGPGSFGRYIFFPGNDANPQVLAHELAHIRRRHTVDIILVSLLQAFFWPNVFLVWIKNELREIHEFEADALTPGDTGQYAGMLLAAAFQTDSISIMHSFINQSIKRRIMMLNKKNGMASPVKASLLAAASLLAVISLGLSIQSCNKHGENTKPVDANVVISPKYVYVKADVMPDFKGSLGDYLGNTLKYPEYARAHKIEGRVVVKFAVGSDGTISNAEAIKSPDTSLTRAALAVINKMPPWNPGQMNDGRKVPVWFYLPVLFRLSE